MTNNILFQDIEDNIFEQINDINNENEILLEKSSDSSKIIPWINNHIPKNENKKNLINKKRKDLFKCNKETKTNKNEDKVKKPIFDDNNRINIDNNQTIIDESLKYDKFDDKPNFKSDDDLRYDKYGFPTYSLENQNINLFEINFNEETPNLSKEIPNSNDIVISTFNYDSYKKEKINKYYIFIPEPKFISFSYILNNHKKYITKIWSKEIKIFVNENDFYNTLKNGKIIQKVYDLLSKNISYKADKRKYDADGMINKIKTELQNSILNYINSFDEMKNNEIYTPKKNLINNKIAAHFNLIYLRQNLYNILSNDSSESNYNTNKDKILIIKSQNFTFFSKHFCLTIQNCLDIFRYKQLNPHFKNKLVEFLNKEYKEFKDDITDVKDYIASLLLLAYNFERFFYLRLKNGEKNN